MSYYQTDLFQIDLKNETTGEFYRTFVGYDKLKDMLHRAEVNKTYRDWRFNTIVKLINNINYHLDDSDADVIANYLVNNGVIIPPCNVGTTVYLPGADGVESYEIISFKYDNINGLQFQVDDEDGEYHDVDILGHEVFLTYEEANSQLNKDYSESTHSEDIKTNNTLSSDENNVLHKIKDIIKKYYKFGECGIYDTHNFVGDPIVTIYKDDKVTVSICYDYSYFEICGLSKTAFRQLKDFYNELK